ncbi:hypothetical protein SAMN04488063_2202 [Halopelagius inordinatus]|uniref:Uncharacterized protein n=1 Tax=Halopelagius inordinatus TaxID=553467 RepID=A0A1I2S766_9EURY|nr:hypothetical protein [Halopelagius inordinatus]SFG48735.1 hypothetical protein SAMN04488063_2202 [Halopelagius inordinatus]
MSRDRRTESERRGGWLDDRLSALESGYDFVATIVRADGERATDARADAVRTEVS